MTIDFSRIEIFTDVAHQNCSICDLRQQFADVIYNVGSGIEALSLAMKIYNSDGPVEYNEREVRLIDTYTMKCCSPAFIEAMNRILGHEAKIAEA
ncbi:MAG: hypothetical protein HDR88_04420 [Bacteroides sp.]|nr:hypothetical protein [Bacteroides sp.]